MPRVIAGHGWRQTSSPPSPRTDLPSASSPSMSIPSDGPPSEQTLIGSTGNGLRKQAPTSVPPDRLMIGTAPPPATRWSQRYGSGFHGSPVEPRILSDDRSWRAGHSSP